MTTRLKVNMLLTNSAILFGIVLVIAVFVYISVTVNIVSNTDRELISYSSQIRSFFPLLDGVRNPETTEAYESLEEQIANASLSFSVFNDLFQSLHISKHLPEEKLLDIAKRCFSSDLGEVKSYNEASGVFHIHEYSLSGENYRVCTSVTADEAGKIRITQLISNMDEKNNMSNRLLRTLILAGVLGMAISFAFGLLITNRAVGPIEENIRRQKQFVADASHELRTPITIVRTNLDVVKSSGEDRVSEQMEWIDAAYSETERMQKLIDELLMLARSDLSQSIYEFVPVDIIACVKLTVDRMKEVAAQKDIMLALHVPDDPMIVYGDMNRLEQLIMIILDNAVTYSPGGTTVMIGLERAASFVLMRISDEGIGIDIQDHEKIFERFYRSDKARSRRQGGTGLGLSIAKLIVDAHSGRISVDSKKNEGTTITVEIPLGE